METPRRGTRQAVSVFWILQKSREDKCSLFQVALLCSDLLQDSITHLLCHSVVQPGLLESASISCTCQVLS